MSTKTNTILQETTALFKAVHIYQRHLPKLERYTLWKRIEDLIIEIIEYCTRIRLTKDTSKKLTMLETLSSNTDVLKIFIRLAYETKCIDQKKYFILEEHLVAIGRMIGGWIKYTHAPN